MYKRLMIVTSLLAAVVLLGSCTSLLALWPGVEAPANADASMLVLEAGEGVPGDSEMLFNSNFTGWAPWVVDEAGELVVFKPFDSEARLDSFYYAENLAPGTYTLKGFLHVYTDYSKLGAGQSTSYGPFMDYAYHVKQYLPLDEEVTVALGAGEMETFGRYYITSQWKDGASGTSDDRWKVVESSVEIQARPDDRKALRVAKNWATPDWKLWNARNPEEAADE